MWKGNLKHPGLATQSGVVFRWQCEKSPRTPPECSPGWLDGTLWLPWAPHFGCHRPNISGWVWFSINLPMDFRRFSMEFREGLLSSRFSLPMATSLRGRPWRSGLQTADRWGPEWPVIFIPHGIWCVETWADATLKLLPPCLQQPVHDWRPHQWQMEVTKGWRSELTNVSKSGCGKSFTYSL